MFWNAIYTKPRTERKVIQQLDQMGIQAYCPMIPQIHQWTDRKKIIMVPAISSYVFVKIKENEKNLVFLAPGTMHYVFWQGKHAIIWNHEIEIMKMALSGKVESVLVSQYMSGDRMKIPNGCFKDQEVLVHKRDDKHLFVILEQTGLRLSIKLW
jgi:transcriptional antiterminator RfaH